MARNTNSVPVRILTSCITFGLGWNNCPLKFNQVVVTHVNEGPDSSKQHIYGVE